MPIETITIEENAAAAGRRPDKVMHVTPPNPSRPLTAGGITWRVLATALCLAVLVTGQLTRSNDLFPFGVLDQFSTGTDPDGEVVSTCLQGRRGNSAPFDIAFGVKSVGIARSDVENTRAAITKDPGLLAPLAATFDSHHRDQTPLTSLVLCQRITHLRGGIAHGSPEFVEVARWTAP